MIRLGPNDPPLTVAETAAITRITGMAAIRRGQLTTRQMKAIDRILDGAKKRAEQGK